VTTRKDDDPAAVQAEMANAPDQKRAKMNAIKKYTAAPVF
jgi:hypothetical protein